MQSNTSQEPVYPSFHGSRKHKRTTLLILSGLCLLACGVLVSMGVVSAKQGGGPLRSVELTSQSTKAKYAEFLDFLPSEMRELVDDNVDPCDNFHKWACGSWEDEEKIPADRSGWAFAWDGDAEDISHELQDLMVKDHGKPGAYYRACMNTDLVEHLGLAPAKPWLGVVDSINDLESFAVVLAKFHRAEVGVFFDWWLATDDHDPTRMLLMVDQGGLDLPDETYYNVNSTKNLEHRRVYRHFLTQLYGLFGVDAKEAKEWADTVIRIESTMASHATDDNTMVHCPRHNLATMTKAFPNFPWNTYFKHMGSDIEVAKDFKQISLTCPKWLKAFDDLIAKEPLENIRIYLKSHFMFNVSPLLTKKFFDINLVLDKNLYGVSAHPTRHHKCVAAAKAALPFLVSKMFVEEYFPPSSKKRATAMLENIRIQFEFDLKTVTWMAEDTRTKALDKLRKIFFEVGYPSVWPQYHFEVTDKSYFQNSLRSSQWRTHSKWSRLGKPVERHRWTMSPATVNAYYDNGVNGVFVPAGLLQPPFFNLSEPMARNYGSAGAIMAHELTHGFDNSGRKYDANCRKREWWDKPTIHEYKSREKCIADYYNKFKVVGHHVDGKNTLGENIADIGGVKMAYLAFVADAAMIHRSDPSTKLDTLNHKRLFWTAFAQSWCGKNRRRVAQLNLITDVHSPDKFRIIGPLSQNVHFANDFDCAFGSTMNPMKRCNLW